MDYVAPIIVRKSMTVSDVTTNVDYYRPPISISGINDESYPEYNNATTYAVGTFVKLDAIKKTFRCTTAGTVGKHPLSYPAEWVDYGPLNTWKMLSTDEFLGGKSTGTDAVITMDFSRCDTFAFVSADFTSVRVQVFNDTLGTIEYDNEYVGRDYGALSYAEFYYKEFKTLSRIIVTGLPVIPSSRIKLTFTGAVSIGGMVVGIKRNLGITLVGSAVKFDDTSKISTSQVTGARTVTRYGSVRVITCNVVIDSDLFNETANQIEEVIGRNILWIPTDADKFAETVTIGYIETMDLPIEGGSRINTKTTIIGVL